MSMRTYSRVHSFPSPDSNIPSPAANQLDQAFAPKLINLQQPQGCRISADRLSKILDASMISHKMSIRMAIDAISPTTCNNADRKFINWYLDSTVLLLDACNNVQLRLESIRTCLDSIPIGLHYLEGVHEPSKVVLQRAIVALESSSFRDNYSKIKKSMSRMRTFSRKLSVHMLTYQNSGDGSSPELFKALSSSWEIAVFAIGVLSFATSFRSVTSTQCVQPPKAELWTTLLNGLSNKMRVLPKKPNESQSMEELESVDLAAQSLLKLISTWKKDGDSSLRRLTVKAVAGELKRRKEELEKALPMLEDNIGELFTQIVALRISLFGMLSKARKEEVFEMAYYSSCEESKMNIDVTEYVEGVSWIKVKTKVTKRSCSLGRFGPHFIGFIKGWSIKQRSLNV